MGFISGMVRAAGQVLHALGLFVLLAFCAVLTYFVVATLIALIQITLAVIAAIVF